VHPDPNHLLIMAGDKWGKIGFFEPDHSETDECVTVCTVHSRPITSIVVDPAESHRLFFTSYDSIVRQLDVDSRKFVAVWDCDEDDHGSLTTCSFDHHRGQVLAQCHVLNLHDHVLIPLA
jgi:WD40 repeat protein